MAAFPAAFGRRGEWPKRLTAAKRTQCSDCKNQAGPCYRLAIGGVSPRNQWVQAEHSGGTPYVGCLSPHFARTAPISVMPVPISCGVFFEQLSCVVDSQRLGYRERCMESIELGFKFPVDFAISYRRVGDNEDVYNLMLEDEAAGPGTGSSQG